MNSFQPLVVQVLLSHSLAPSWKRPSMSSHFGKRWVLAENSSIEPKILGYLRASAGAVATVASSATAAIAQPSQRAADRIRAGRSMPAALGAPKNGRGPCGQTVPLRLI